MFLGVTDPFMLYIKVALLAGLFLARRRALPGLALHRARPLPAEQRYSLPSSSSARFFFLAGGAFAYYVAFPFAVEFLLEVGDDFQPAITGPSYLSFLMTVILGLALMFELPVIIFALPASGW